MAFLDIPQVAQNAPLFLIHKYLRISIRNVVLNDRVVGLLRHPDSPRRAAHLSHETVASVAMRDPVAIFVTY